MYFFGSILAGKHVFFLTPFCLVGVSPVFDEEIRVGCRGFAGNLCGLCPSVWLKHRSRGPGRGGRVWGPQEAVWWNFMRQGLVEFHAACFQNGFKIGWDSQNELGSFCFPAFPSVNVYHPAVFFSRI